MFISTSSIYGDQSVVGIDEQSPTTQMPAGLDPYTLDPAHAGQYYGALKTQAKKEVEKNYPGINTIFRPCLIVGPLDRTERFTYWPARIDKGGEVLAPDKPDDPCQFIDSRDLAAFMICMAEAQDSGCTTPLDWRSRSHRRDVVQCEGHHDGGRAIHLGAMGLSADAERSAVAQHDGVAAAVWTHGRLSAAQFSEIHRQEARIGIAVLERGMRTSSSRRKRLPTHLSMARFTRGFSTASLARNIELSSATNPFSAARRNV